MFLFVFVCFLSFFLVLCEQPRFPTKKYVDDMNGTRRLANLAFGNVVFDFWLSVVTCISTLGHSLVEFVFYFSLYPFMLFSLPSL